MIRPAPADSSQMNRKSAGLTIQKLIVVGFLVTLMLLNFGFVSAQEPDEINATIAETTLLTATPTSIASALQPVEENPYTVRVSASRNGRPVPQEEKEKAAANYQEIRERFLLTGSVGPALAPTGPDLEGAAFNGTAGPVMDPGGIPHYFGPYPNWANSPMPMGNISSITVEDGGRFYVPGTPPPVTIADAYFTGSGATATATVVGGAIQSITVTNGGANYTAPIVIIGGPGSGAVATANLGGPYYSGMRKFVDTLPGLDPAGVNNLGQYIPIAQKDTTTFTTPPSDYYEIAVVQFTEKMHSDLPETTLRGYVQLETPVITGDHYPLNYPNGTNITNSVGSPVYAVHKPHFLGPLIIAGNGTPVRVKFYNYLPVGSAGNLFIPVDTTVMGAGMGPQGMNTSPIYYTENRATLHLHGGATPWISDGTPYQWITPAGEYTSYPEGVSVFNVPDMPDPGDGSQTFFYTNQQSARLMFYHDHSHGITRLNVYAGEAAGYLVTDPQENDMILGTDVTGINPGLVSVLPDVGIPLVIQDRTWVDNRTIAAQDPTWNWGTNPGLPMTGDLWYPHVYMTAQNPFDDTGVNAFGRWHYGPWFFPAVNVPHPPVANPYFGDINFTGEPPQIPGTPNPSTPGEAFMDTPIVNGVAYPNITVDPRTYRFRILNACNDRALNLQLYVADANVTTADGRNNTEVWLVPRVPTPGFPANWPTDNRAGGSPHPSTIGPDFIMIGTEGGFLPAPVVMPNQPITFVDDPTLFNVGNVDKHTILLMSAERADVLVDFSAYAGRTLILYNDAPAAFPARVPQYDYYTGSPDLTSTGGVPTVQPGYGPNTRTIMQIKVNPTAPAAPYNLAALESVFAMTASKRGVFESSQPPVILPQVAYGSAYNRVFTENNFGRIADHFKNFTTLSGLQLNISFQPKSLHDEMGGVYDQYGRMSGMLGLETPRGGAVIQQFIPYGYSSPPTDVVMSSLDEYGGPQLGDGTQIWRITHNGVDSHPIHWHMYNVQVINRVGWDGFIRAPHPTELGWKDTVRISPLEDTVVALRPVAVSIPFTIPDKVRAIEPNMPLGALVDEPPGGFFDPAGQPVTVVNHLVNFGWEYVWHCHILAHEEMDMMHSQAINVAPAGAAPSGLVSNEVNDTATNTLSVFLAWQDNSDYESDWIIQRSNISENNWVDFKKVPSYSTSQTGGWAMAIDGSYPPDTVPNNSYRVIASNVVGDDYVYAGSAGFPVQMRNSTPSGINSTLAAAPPDQASFSTNTTTGNAPLAVAFTDLSSGPDTITGWDWDFGDGNFAADNGMQNPIHVYEIPGSYDVTLTAMTIGGNVTSTATTITVTAQPPPAMPTASFVNVTPREGVAPFTVTFNADASTSNPSVWATWRWTFGDGTFSSVKNPTHTYLTGGNYTVSLAATNLGGTNAMTRVGYVNVTNATVTTASGVGVYRPSLHTFYLRTPGSPTTAIDWGISSDIPVTGDWNGNGITDVGVYRPSLHTFYLRTPGSPTTAIDWGISSDIPVTGDWNGNGITDVGVYRPSSHTFYLRTPGSPTTAIDWGISSDIPVTGDWNGNGITDVGVYRPSSHTLYLRTPGSPTTAIDWGISTDTPVTGDWNANSITDVGIFRPSTHMFYLRTPGSPTTAIDWGISTDLPVTGKW